MKHNLAITFCLFCTTMAGAQSKFDIKGLVIDKATNEVVEGATVQLLSLPDSSFVKGAAANALGNFTIESVKKAKYTLKISSIG